MTTETAHAAYWLYNRSEPHPFERITLLWRGWTTRNGHRRRMSRRRDSSEAALLDDLQQTTSLGINDYWPSHQQTFYGGHAKNF